MELVHIVYILQQIESVLENVMLVLELLHFHLGFGLLAAQHRVGNKARIGMK